MSSINAYREQPDDQRAGMPPGIPFIIANEAAERFSYYGMRAILVVYMTQYLTDRNGALAVMSEHEAQGYFHLFVSAIYFLPLLGAVIADGMLGKYRTIILLSLAYCLGHLAMSLDSTRLGLMLGQGLIALGAGGIKPCVSAHVGDQFGKTNQHLIGTVFSWFYLAINFGAFGAMLLMPWLLSNFGPGMAFGVPGVLMLIATVIFWSGRYRFVHIKPVGSGFLKDLSKPHERQTLLKLALIYAFFAIFWSLFDQTGSSWVLQAQKMDRVLLGIELLPSQIQAANPLLILILTPLFTYVIYPKLRQWLPLTDLNKIAIGFFLAVVAFTITSLIQANIDQGGSPSILWQLIAYVALTSAEVMVSITGLEFSYRQAPKSMKSLVMSLYMLSVAMGNLLAGGVNFLIGAFDKSGLLSGDNYFWFFTGLMLVTALMFLWLSLRYYENNSVPDDQV
ncbi:MAG: POT family MFS transporter [Gammaproteobacteria bacterium]|nr:POT family MFS transporter [Gammaproteobacteria bacterium]